MKANIDDVTLLTRNKLEIFQICIFKQILGMYYQAIKYISRLSSINSERLLHEAYNLEKEKMQIGETFFCNYVTNVLDEIGVSNVRRGQIEHDRNNIMEKPVITKAILIQFNVFSQTVLAHSKYE